MPEIFVCGHGGWGTIGRSNVFVDIPGFTEVVLYKEIGDVLYVSEAEAILSRSKKAREPVRVIHPYQNSPDMTLYPATEFWSRFGKAAKAGGSDWLAVGEETQLSDLLKRWAGARIHWIACSVRELG